MLRKMDSRQHILNLPCCMGSSVDEKGVFGSDYCGCRIHCLHPLDKYCGCSCTLAPMVPTLMSSARDIPTGNGDPKQQHSLVWPDLEGQWLTWWGKIGIIGFVTSQRICCSWPQGLKSCKKKLWWCRIRYLHKQRANPSYTDDAAVLVPSQLEQLFVTLSD